MDADGDGVDGTGLDRELLPSYRPARQWRLWLRRAISPPLIAPHLEGALLGKARLEAAFLNGAHLNEAVLGEAHLR